MSHRILRHSYPQMPQRDIGQMNEYENREVKLENITCLGGIGFPCESGEEISIRFDSKGVAILGQQRSARFSYLELVDISISGPGKVTTGGGFVGGGFGVSGALEGIAVATILNVLTTKTKIHTFVSIETNFGELHLHYSDMEPGALRVALSHVYLKMRQCNSNWRQARLAIAQEARVAGQIDEAELNDIVGRLTTGPAWPDPQAEAKLREQEKQALAQLDFERSAKGKCPNCDRVIKLHTEECPHCNASFGIGSSWKIKPLLA